MKNKILRILMILWGVILWFASSIGFGVILQHIPFISKFSIEAGILLSTLSFVYIVYKLGKK